MSDASLLKNENLESYRFLGNSQSFQQDMILCIFLIDTRYI